MEELSLTLRWCWFSLYELATRGFTPIKRALVAAQYHDPRGLFYGGSPGNPEPSVRVVERALLDFGFVARGKDGRMVGVGSTSARGEQLVEGDDDSDADFLAELERELENSDEDDTKEPQPFPEQHQHHNRFRNNRFLWIDVHTGLGPYGTYTVLGKNDPSRKIPPSWAGFVGEKLGMQGLGANDSNGMWSG